MSPEPLRVLLWLVRQFSSPDAANAAVGDMLDELDDRTRAGRAPRFPRLWVNTQAIKVVATLAVLFVLRMWHTSRHILWEAARSLRRSPGYSFLVIGLLGVGIAAGTITYSVVDAVVLSDPLAIDESDRLVNVSTMDDKFKSRISAEGFRQIHDQVGSFEGIARHSGWIGDIVTIGPMTDQVDVEYATIELFHLLRFTPTIGRLWTADEEKRKENVVVLGYRFWKDVLHGDPNVIGQSVVDERTTYQVIGVLGAESDMPDLSFSRAAMWVPIDPTSDQFAIIGRLRSGVSRVRIADEIQKAIGVSDWRPAVAPLIEAYVRQVRGWMLLALGAAGLIILLACVNAANVMLTRAFRRTHELAVRSSLGASQRQIALSVMTEGVILSTAASVCALLFAVWGIAAARLSVTTYLPGTFRASTIALNSRVLVAAMLAAVATGVISSLVPAFQASRVSVLELLKDAGPTVTASGRSWRSRLLTGEIACVSVLLVVSWLFVTSLIRVIGIDLGVDPSHLLAISSNREFTGTVGDVRRRLESVPGITAVAVARGASLPLIGRAFGGAWITTSVIREDAANVPAVKTLQYVVTPNYFDVAGIRFRRGSTWSETALDAVVLDERVATQLFGREDPLGHQVRGAATGRVFTVVGIVSHVYARGPEDTDEPAAYFPLPASADTRNFAALFARTATRPQDMVQVVADALAPFAPEGKMPYVHTADTAVRNITATRRFNGGLMMIFGAIAILIGTFGIHGVTAAIVAQQTREIGVRVALGATPRLIRRRVLAHATTHVLSGLAIGLPVAWWISRGLTAYLFQVTPSDPAVYAGVAALVGVVGVGAALLPANRAARTDPVITLRS